MDKVRSISRPKTEMGMVHSRCSKHSAIPIIRAVSVVQSAMNLSMVCRSPWTKNGVCSVYMTITSTICVIYRSSITKWIRCCSSTYAPRCAKCAYPICPEEVVDQRTSSSSDRDDSSVGFWRNYSSDRHEQKFSCRMLSMWGEKGCQQCRTGNIALCISRIVSVIWVTDKQLLC